MADFVAQRLRLGDTVTVGIYLHDHCDDKGMIVHVHMKSSGQMWTRISANLGRLPLAKTSGMSPACAQLEVRLG